MGMGRRSKGGGGGFLVEDETQLELRCFLYKILYFLLVVFSSEV